MTRQHCEKIAAQEMISILESMPDRLSHSARQVRVDLRWAAPSECESYLGLFEGPTLEQLQSGAVSAVPVVYLFLQNLRNHAGDNPKKFREEARITLLHELGHFFGWDEVDLEGRGLQ